MDGPTDAAGGYVDGTTAERLAEQGICIADILHDNNAYYALKAADGLIMTGPTGTNVNDLTVLLIDVVPTEKKSDSASLFVSGRENV